MVLNKSSLRSVAGFAAMTHRPYSLKTLMPFNQLTYALLQNLYWRKRADGDEIVIAYNGSVVAVVNVGGAVRRYVSWYFRSV
jgi:hypothetical protein